MKNVAMWTPARSALLCGAVIVVCSNWAAASRNELGELDLSDASPFDFLLSAQKGGGFKCNRAGKCGSNGGECLPMGACKTVEMNEKCSKKDGGKCVCCAQDKKGRCKASKNRLCSELGGFCIKKKKACAQGYLLPGQCNCEGKDPKAKQGHCCLPEAPPPPPPTQPPPPPTTQPPPPPPTTPPPTSCVSPWVLIGTECYHIFRTPDLDWYGAREECKKMDADLAVLDTETKQISMTNYLKDKYSNDKAYFWLGGNDFSGPFTWVSGAPVKSGWNVNGEPWVNDGDSCIFSWPYGVQYGNYDLLFSVSCTAAVKSLRAICQQ